MPKIDVSPDAGDCHLEAGIVVIVINQGRVSRVIADSDNDLQYIVVDEDDPNGLPEAGVAEARPRNGEGDLTNIAAKVNCSYSNARILDAHDVAAPKRLALVRNNYGACCVLDWTHMRRTEWTTAEEAQLVETFNDFERETGIVPEDADLDYAVEDWELRDITVLDGEDS